MEQMRTPTVAPRWLLQHLDDPDLRLLDVRWSLSKGAEEDGYRCGHIPHATFCDLDAELAAPSGPGGRHPLPDPAAFSAAMRAKGVSHSSRIVVYDQVTGSAARAWWLLRASGHRAVSVLDGGVSGYLQSGGELTSAVEELARGDFRAADFSGWLGVEQIAQGQAPGHLILDGRAGERFRGEPNPLDPRPGHMPRARSLPWNELYREGWLRSRAEVRELLAARGYQGQPLLAYCGSGVSATAMLLAFASAGIEDGQLYPGSWSEWAQDEARPVALEP
ncbi:MAG: sulfurtransferase [Candidatus Dormibacteria bacterium]